MGHIKDNASTQPINSHVRAEAQRVIDEQKKDLTHSQIERIKNWSQGLKALQLLKDGVLKANNACKLCNTKGYQLVRGKHLGPHPKTGKPVYEWETVACNCIRHKPEPTNLDGLHYVAPPEPEPEKDETKPNKRKPAKKAADSSEGPKRPRKTPKKPSGDTAG